LPQIDLLAPQADQFRDAEPVAIGEQDHRGVAVPVASKQSSRGDQPVDFSRGQMLPAASRGIELRLRWGHRAVTFPKTMIPARFHPHKSIEHRSTDARRQQQAADSVVASREACAVWFA
jgi:hypothetical protein